MKRQSIAVAAIVALTGCYHATIETGRPPSPEVIEEPFASAWVYGLVPPKTVEAASECANGVSRVETQLSFVNQLVGFLTLGIYTPMTILVTCAASDDDADASGAIEIDGNAPVEDIQAAFAAAADLAAEGEVPVLVKMVRQ